MTNTNVRIIQNERGGNVDFLDLEDEGCNKFGIPNGESREVGCVVPWATTDGEFAGHHMEVRDADTERTLFYIWQLTVGGDNRVRVSVTGFEDPGAAISGNSAAGGRNRVLRIVADGISLNDL